jgi:hypothetical protein
MLIYGRPLVPTGISLSLISLSLYMADQKNPKEASNIFHSIIKASVSKTATEKKEKKEVKQKPKTDSSNGTERNG